MADNLIGYELEIEGLSEVISKLGAYDELSTKHLTHAMTQSVVSLESAIKPLVPVFRGRLRGSIGSQVIQDTGSVVGKVGSTLKSEEYPVVIEFGRRPGAKMPPPSALERWVHLVLGVPDNKAASVAFNVARSIARKGIKGRRFMQRGYEASKSIIMQYFAAALTALTDDLSNGRK